MGMMIKSASIGGRRRLLRLSPQEKRVCPVRESEGVAILVVVPADSEGDADPLDVEPRRHVR